jgi:hypothetical protein
MGYPRHKGYPAELRAAPIGGKVIITNEENRSELRFQQKVHGVRTGVKTKYGIVTSQTIVGEGANMVATLVVTKRTKDPAPFYEAPPVVQLERKEEVREVVAPPPPSAPTLGDVPDEARQLYKDLFLLSMESLPGADAATHYRNARAGVVEYATRWGP